MSTLKSNIRAALLVHITTLINSFVAGLILPKYLSVESFGYWQYFAFFAGCMEVLLFGSGTGLYLHFGGKDYKEIDRSLIHYIFFKWLYVALILAVVGVILIQGFTKNVDKRNVFYLLIIGLFILNTGTFFSYILQATNRIKDNLHTVLLSNIITICGFLCLIFFEVYDYVYYICIFVIAQFTRDIYLLRYNKKVFVNNGANKSVEKQSYNIRPIIQSGIFLMMADYSIYIMFGTGRLFIENKWGIEAFSKFSFAMSLVLLMITFINQIGLVLFPALKQLKYEKMLDTILNYDKKIDLALMGVFVLYFCARKILMTWLPQYGEAISYFGILVPICVFDGRLAMLINPILKAIREERRILYINVSFLFSSCICFLFLDIFNVSIYFYCILFVLISICRCFISEWQMDKVLVLKFNKNLFISKLIICGMFYMMIL